MLFTILLYILTLLKLGHSFDCTSQKISIVTDFTKNTATKSAEINATDFPWLVAVLKEESEVLEFLCSGIIVQSKFVLTAASCVVHLPPSMIKVGFGFSLIHNPLKFNDSTDCTLQNVSEKYYPFHADGQDNDRDLAVLKLQNDSLLSTPQLSTLLPSHHLSKHCFSLGWGATHQESKINKSCPSLSFPDVFSNLHLQSSENHQFLGDSFGFRSLSLRAIFTYNLFNYFFSKSPDENVQEGTCHVNELSHLKIVKVSTKPKFHYKYLCAEDSLLCVSGWNSTDLTNKVDVGSPIFCKIKTPKTKNSSYKQKSYMSENQFGLAGIITNKQVEQIPFLKFNSTISVIRANNITHFAHFIFAVLKRNF